MLNRLMCGTVFTQTDGIVGPDIDDRKFHQRAEAHGASTIIGEDKEAGSKRPEFRQSHAIRNGAHSMFANSKVKIPARIAAVAGPLKLPRRFEAQMGFRRWRQIRGPAEQPWYFCGKGIEYFSGRVARGCAFGIGLKYGQSTFPFIGQSAGLHTIDVICEIRILFPVGGK